MGYYRLRDGRARAELEAALSLLRALAALASGDGADDEN
jgi:hypothetical protein